MSPAGVGCRCPCWRGFLFVLSRRRGEQRLHMIHVYISIYLYVSRSLQGRSRSDQGRDRSLGSDRSSFDSLKVRFGLLRTVPLPFFVSRIRLECPWSWCLTSFDVDLQSQADQRPSKYNTPGLQSSDTSPLTHICEWVAEHGTSSNSEGYGHVVGYKSLSTY